MKLADEIKEFRRTKKWLVPALFSLGLLGLVLPVVPGLLLIALALLLTFPSKGGKIVEKLKSGLHTVFGSLK